MHIKNLVNLLRQYHKHLAELVDNQVPERAKKIKKDIGLTAKLIENQIQEIKTLREREANLMALKQRAGTSKSKSRHKQSPQNNQMKNQAPSFDDFDEGMTPLMVASMLGLPNMVQALIDAGASVNRATPEGKTAVTYAIEYGHDDLLNLLIVKGASFRSVYEGQQFHPLIVAVRQNAESVVKLIDGLMTRFPQPEDKHTYDYAVIALITRPLVTKYEAILELMDSEQFNQLVSRRSNDVLQQLAYFLPKCNRGLFLVTRFPHRLLELDDERNRTSERSVMYSALSIAANSASVDVVKCLLDYGFSPNEHSPSCVPPIVAAMNNKDPVVARCLFEAGADLSVQFNGESLLYWAVAQTASKELLKFLLEEQGMLRKLNPAHHARIFHHAIESENVAACELLLQQGFDPNQSIHRSNVMMITTPMLTTMQHYLQKEPLLVSAVRKGNINIIALLLNHSDKKSNLEYFDLETGNNILMLGVATGSPGIVRILLKHLDDESLFAHRNQAGKNVLQYAAANEQVHIFYMLWSWLAGVRGETIPMPVKLSVIEDRMSVDLPAKLCMYLISAGIEPSAIDALREYVRTGEAYPQDEFLLAVMQVVAAQSDSVVRDQLQKCQYDALSQFYGTLLVECAKGMNTTDPVEVDQRSAAFETIITMNQSLLATPTRLVCEIPPEHTSARAYLLLAHLSLFFVFDKIQDHFMRFHDALESKKIKLSAERMIRLCELILGLQKASHETFASKQLFDDLMPYMRESLISRLTAYIKKYESLIKSIETLIRTEMNKQIKVAKKQTTTTINSQPKAIVVEKSQSILFFDEIQKPKKILTSDQVALREKKSVATTEMKKSRTDTPNLGSNANKRSRQEEAERIKQEQERQLELIQQAAIQYQKNQAEQELQARQRLEKEQARKHLRELALQVNTVAKQVTLNKMIRKKFNLLGPAAEQAYLVGSTAVKILKGAIKDNNADWDFLAAEFDRTYFVENNHIPGLFTYKGKNTTQNMHDKIDVILAPAACLHSPTSPVVELAKECQRRDTTRKAVFIDVDGNVYDPTGYGLADIESDTIRVIIQQDYATGNPVDIQATIEARLLEDPKRLARWLKEMIEGAQPEFHLSEVLKRIDLQKIVDPKQQDELFFKIKKLTEDLADDGLDKYNRVIAEFGLLEKLTWLREQWKSRQTSRSPNANRLFAPTAPAAGTEQPIATSTSIKRSM